MAERESAGKQEAGAPRSVRIFCDADVLLAGAASTTGASHILLQMSELTLLKCITSQHATKEAERNLLAKLPAALPAFRLILEVAIEVILAGPPFILQPRDVLARIRAALSRLLE